MQTLHQTLNFPMTMSLMTMIFLCNEKSTELNFSEFSHESSLLEMNYFQWLQNIFTKFTDQIVFPFLQSVTVIWKKEIVSTFLEHLISDSLCSCFVQLNSPFLLIRFSLCVLILRGIIWATVVNKVFGANLSFHVE